MLPEPHTQNHHDCLVRVTGKVNEDIRPGEPVSWDIGDHFGDSALIKVSLVTNTPGDHIGVATLHIMLMGDGFFLITRTGIGSYSEHIASGKIDQFDVTPGYARDYAKIHRALWVERGSGLTPDKGPADTGRTPEAG